MPTRTSASNWNATAAELDASVAKRGALISLRRIAEQRMNRKLVLDSAARAGRLPVAHEAVQAGGFGAEVTATVAEQQGVPVRRVGAARVPVGCARTLQEVVRILAQELLQELKLLVNGDGRRHPMA